MFAQSGFGADCRAIVLNLGGQLLNAICCGASLHQDFNSASIIDDVSLVNRLPQCKPCFAQSARRLDSNRMKLRVRLDDRQLRFFHLWCTSRANVLLNFGSPEPRRAAANYPDSDFLGPAPRYVQMDTAHARDGPQEY